MKPIFPILFLSFIALSANAQLNPVDWSFHSEKISDNEYEVILTADIKKGWVIYSQFLESDEGPIATSFSFDPAPNVQFVGNVKEKGHMKEEEDPLFGMVVKKLSGKVDFVQKVKTTGKPALLKGYLTFMTCDSERCLPPKDVDFNISLK